VLAAPANKGEFYLTDAFQYMIDRGAKIRVIDVEGWYDAGKLDTLLETNRTILEKRGMARHPHAGTDVQFVEPVYVENGVTLSHCTIGPNVSITTGTVVEHSTLRDTIVGGNAKLTNCTLSNSLVGDDVILDGVKGEVTIGDHSEVRVR
jgi:glucose-1-phosphate thymidylyltransferase